MLSKGKSCIECKVVAVNVRTSRRRTLPFSPLSTCHSHWDELQLAELARSDVSMNAHNRHRDAGRKDRYRSKADCRAPYAPSRLWQTLLLLANDARPFAELSWQTLFATTARRNQSSHRRVCGKLYCSATDGYVEGYKPPTDDGKPRNLLQRSIGRQLCRRER